MAYPLSTTIDDYGLLLFDIRQGSIHGIEGIPEQHMLRSHFSRLLDDPYGGWCGGVENREDCCDIAIVEAGIVASEAARVENLLRCRLRWLGALFEHGRGGIFPKRENQVRAEVEVRNSRGGSWLYFQSRNGGVVTDTGCVIAQVL